MGYLKLEKVRDIKISKFSSFSMPQNQEEKQITRYEVRFTNKNHPFMWLVCKTRPKILLSNPETSLTTPRLLPLRRSRRSYGNYQSPQSSGSSRNILESLRLRFFGISRERRTSRGHVTSALPSGLWFEVHVCTARSRFRGK